MGAKACDVLYFQGKERKTDPERMRMGLLGPADGDVAALGRAAEFLLNGAKVHRAVYLGVDGALDRAVAAWARKLVGDDPSDAAAWTRSCAIALKGSPQEIDRFVAIERARLRLKALETLPDRARTVEMIGDRVAVLVNDKASLDEEDIAGANIIVFGKTDAPLVKPIGSRWFISPGLVGASGSGPAVIDDEKDDIEVSLFDGAGKLTARHVLTVQRAAKMRVQEG